MAEFFKPPQEQTKRTGAEIEAPIIPSESENLIESFRENLNRVLEEEQKPEEPKISIDIFYSFHRAPRDLENLAKQFDRADIFIPEVPGWSPWLLQYLRDVSEGRKTPEQVESEKRLSSSLRKNFEIIYNSHKPITLVDIPEGHPTEERLQELSSSYYLEVVEFELGEDFDYKLDFIRQYLKNDADAEKRREKYILFQLKPKIQELLQIYPLLKEKEEIKVLLSFGACHTGVYHALRKTKQKISRRFSMMPFIFGFADEGRMRARFGKEIDNQLAAKILLEANFYKIFGQELKEVTSDTGKIVDLVRKIISQFSFNEIREIFSSIQGEDIFLEEFPSFSSSIRIRDRITERMREKDLRIPSSKAELDKFLGLDKNGRKS